MKKFSVILIVSVIAMAMAFAGISGKAQMAFGYNFDTRAYGFVNGIKFTVSAIELASGEGSKAGEGAIHAEIAGSFTLDVAKNGDKTAELDKVAQTVKLSANIDKANIVGENWSVSILGPTGPFDLAKSALDKDGNNAVTKKVAPIDKGQGFGFTYGDIQGALGFNGDSTYTTLYAWAGTKGLEVADGLKLDADVVFNMANEKTLIGGGLSVAYASDAVKATLAGDASITLANETRAQVVYDGAAKVVAGPATIDAYYNSDELLSAGVSADLKDYAPVTVKVTCNDILDAQKIGVSGKITADALVVEPAFNYAIKANTWNASAKATYTADDYKAVAFVKYTSDVTLPISISLSSDKIIAGASLEFSYGCDFVASVKVLGTAKITSTISF